MPPVASSLWINACLAALLQASLQAAEAPLPPVRQWGWPLAESDAADDNFNAELPERNKFSAEPVRHVGVDWAYLGAGREVKAVAAGRVRFAAHVPTLLVELPASVRPAEVDPAGVDEPPPPSAVRKWGWGGLVIVEHQVAGARGQPEQIYCSLYGHLDRTPRVKVGQDIATGDVLGVIGAGPSADNGWYVPHLHFGIRRGAYMTPPTTLPVKLNGVEVEARVLDLTRNEAIVDLAGRREALPIKRYWERFLVPHTGGGLYPNWITGYLPLDRDAAREGWERPGAFLKARVMQERSETTNPPAPPGR
ncbi:MAG: hypothetical protein AMXMBFR7_22650 [Planctomycetota bacterium]